MRKLQNFIRSEGLLIVTVKSQIEEWARHIRSLPEPRLLVYTDTLAKRRKCGAHNVAQYDVVITTFEVRMRYDSRAHFIMILVLATWGSQYQCD